EEVRRVVEQALPRPVTPLYSEISQLLQVALSDALTGQAEPAAALSRAAQKIRRLLEEERPAAAARGSAAWPLALLLALSLLALALWRRRRRGQASARERREERLAWLLLAPALAALALFALAPIVYTAWESLHVHDLKESWRGYPFVGLSNYA